MTKHFADADDYVPNYMGDEATKWKNAYMHLNEMYATQAAQIEALTVQRDELLKVSKNAAAGIVAIYEWLDRVEQAGGAKSISGVAACHAMLTSLRKNGNRTETLILAPLRAAIAAVGEKK